MANQQFKVIYGLDGNAQNISNATWDGSVITVAKGGTGTATGSITGTGALTFTAGGSNNSVILAPTGTGTVNVSGFKITNMATPTSGSDATTKDYVDNLVQGLIVKNAVKVATTAALTYPFSGFPTIDGYTVQDQDRVLVKNQTSDTQYNGIWKAVSGTWSRTDDANTWDELVSAYVFVQVGTSQADTGWVCTIDSGGTLNTTPITWTQFSGVGTYTASLGIKINPSVANQFILDLTGSSGKTAVTTTDSQTLTNKTLTGPIIDTSTTATNSISNIVVTSVDSDTFTAATADQILDTTDKTVYRSVQYIIQIVNGGLGYYHQTQLNIVHDGSVAYITEYGTIITNTSLGTFTVGISGNDVQLKITPTNASSGNPSTVKFLKSAFTL
jgi:hypothetical protein